MLRLKFIDFGAVLFGAAIETDRNTEQLTELTIK